MADTTCGLGSCQPRWLRRFATVKSFMLVYGSLTIIQAAAFGYLVVSLTTMEKRYKISNRTIGIILSGNEISQILFSLILSYYGAQRKRPQWIAWGVAFSALSCFILALPHFVYGPGNDALQLTQQYLNTTVGNKSIQEVRDALLLCQPHNKEAVCKNEDVGNFLVVSLVFLSQFVLGLGNTLNFSLGQTYLDDNAKKTQTSILFAWILAFKTIGPVIGFVLGYMCLSLYIDPYLDPVIKKKDPRWLGAWWLGWIILGTIMFIFVIPIAMFPKNLPIAGSGSSKKISKFRKEVQSEKETSFINNKEENVKYEKKPQTAIPVLKDFLTALKRLSKNKLLMFNNLSTIFYILGAEGHITYVTKYLEVQFLTPATYTVVTAPITLLGMLLGFLISGYLISIYKPRPKWLLGWNVVVGFIFVVGEIIFVFLYCPTTDIKSYFNNNNDFQLLAKCNANCTCANVKYSPVCSEETHTTYYSPCHAGCTTRLNDKMFDNCMCAFQPNITIGSTNGAILKNGPCLTDCSTSLFTFVIVTVFINFLGTSGKIGNLLVNYRCVDIKDKPFAQGLALWMISLIALIPGPILYGFIIDSTCLVWNESCGRKGNCWTYDRTKMRHYFNAAAIVLTSLAMTFDIVVWYLGRELNLYDLPTDTQKKSIKSSSIENIVETNLLLNKQT